MTTTPSRRFWNRKGTRVKKKVVGKYRAGKGPRSQSGGYNDAAKSIEVQRAQQLTIGPKDSRSMIIEVEDLYGVAGVIVGTELCPNQTTRPTFWHFKKSSASTSDITTASRKMKRKSTETHAANGKGKRRALDENEVRKSFRNYLFEADTLKGYRDDYIVSKP